jgi:hypothetical protein
MLLRIKGHGMVVLDCRCPACKESAEEIWRRPCRPCVDYRECIAEEWEKHWTWECLCPRCGCNFMVSDPKDKANKPAAGEGE